MPLLQLISGDEMFRFETQKVTHTRSSCLLVAVKYFDSFATLGAMHSKSKFWIEEECSNHQGISASGPVVYTLGSIVH